LKRLGWLKRLAWLKRLGWLNFSGDRFNRRNWSALYWITKISDIEFITLRESIPHEAGAGRGWIADSFLGNRCGHPRREQSPETCQAKSRDPNYSDHNRTPREYRELRRNPTFAAVTERG
jgi:hypothetical protein